jgi:hypothetical protein
MLAKSECVCKDEAGWIREGECLCVCVFVCVSVCVCVNFVCVVCVLLGKTVSQVKVKLA